LSLDSRIGVGDYRIPVWNCHQSQYFTMIAIVVYRVLFYYWSCFFLSQQLFPLFKFSFAIYKNVYESRLGSIFADRFLFSIFLAHFCDTLRA
jgi:hypothetical protein